MCNKESKSCASEKNVTCYNTNDYLIVVVLYILLVIIISACLF